MRACAGADLGVSRGILPGRSVPFTLYAGLLRGLFVASARLTYAGPESAALREPAYAGGRVALIAAALQAGLGFRLGRLELPLSAGLESGLFVASGRGTETPERGRAAWLAGLGAAELHWMLLTRWLLRVRVEALVPMLRPRFALRAPDGSEQTFHRPDAVAWRSTVGFEVRFP